LLLVKPGLPPGHALPPKAQVPSARGIAKPAVVCRLFLQPILVIQTKVGFIAFRLEKVKNIYVILYFIPNRRFYVFWEFEFRLVSLMI
jgi:hypothetical protein